MSKHIYLSQCNGKMFADTKDGETHMMTEIMPLNEVRQLVAAFSIIGGNIEKKEESSFSLFGEGAFLVNCKNLCGNQWKNHRKVILQIMEKYNLMGIVLVVADESYQHQYISFSDMTFLADAEYENLEFFVNQDVLYDIHTMTAREVDFLVDEFLYSKGFGNFDVLEEQYILE